MQKLLALSFWLLFLPLCAAAQSGTVSGTVVSDDNRPLELATIGVKNLALGTQADAAGKFRLEVPAGQELVLVFKFLGYADQEVSVFVEPGGSKNLYVKLQRTNKELGAVNIRGKRENDTREEVSITKLNPRITREVPSTFNDFNRILTTLPGVVSNNELSSTYSVRGGNYDENLVYVNNIEIYRPFLVTNAQQEGLSFVNPDMVSNIEFSSGGWQPKYGDKLSSVLNITYKTPRKLAGSVTGGLMGGTAHIEAASKNKKITYLAGVRHKNAQYIFNNSLQTIGSYRPVFTDFQTYINFDLSKDSVRNESRPAKTSVGVLASVARNQYLVVPQTSETTFGGLLRPIRLTVFYDGRERMDYDTYQAGVNFSHWFNQKLNSQIILSSFYSNELEYRDTEAFYRFCDVNTNSGEDFNKCLREREIGSRFYHARNKLIALVSSVENRNSWAVSQKSELQFGFKVGQERIDDKLAEYAFDDSADYVINRTYLRSDIDLISYRYNAYVQHTIDLDSLKTLTYGVRASYWNLNDEFTISPRVQFSLIPRSNPDLAFKMAVGLYHQPPFYRELRDREGNLNKNLKAQQSIHAIAGTEYAFKSWNRDFRLTSEVYYKYMTNVVPYEVENVRLRYFAKNNAKAYAAGMDFRVNGEFVKGAESWFSLGLMTTKEDIEGDSLTLFDSNGNPVAREAIGYIRRPTDQNVTIGVFFQDHLPNNPTLKMYLNGIFGSPLPFSIPGEEEFRSRIKGKRYLRVDLGLSKLIVLRDVEKGRNAALESLWLSLEVLNLLGMNNMVSYNYVQDVSGITYAVPNYLSGRLLNLRFIARF